MDVITIGETMALFSPNTPGRMRYASSFDRKFGGAESNLAIGLARLGHEAGWISQIGNDELGKAMLSFIRGEGVDVSNVKIHSENPTGIYFKEFRRAGEIKVQYYRKDSAASQMSIDDINFNYIEKAKFLHVTGITPALSNTCKHMIFEVVKFAKQKNVTVIFDPNVRKSLWGEAEARTTLIELSALADVVLPGLEEGEFLFGTNDPERIGNMFLENGAKKVILKSGKDGTYFFDKTSSDYIPAFKLEQVIDPVGAGDGFAAGYLSGKLDGLEDIESIKRGNAVGALVTQALGDVEGLPEKEEIQEFIEQLNSDITR